MATLSPTWYPRTSGSGQKVHGGLRFAGRATVEKYVLANATATAVVVAVSASLAAGLVPSVTEASAMFTLCIAWILYSWVRVVRSIISPYWIFVVVAALFNGGQALLQVFGLNANGVLDSGFSEVTTASTIIYVSLCMMLFHCGALWRMARQRHQVPETVSHDLDRGGLWLGLLLVLVSVAPMYLQFRADFAEVISSGYFGLYQREVLTNVDNWRTLIAQFMLPGILLLAATSGGRRGIRRFSLVLAAMYVLSYLFMGYRGAAGAAIAAYAWIWHSRIRKLPLYPSLAAGMIVIFVVFPMIRLHRSAIGEDRLSWRGFMATLENYDNPATASLREMGSSMATIANTMDLVPNDREFEYGKTYFFAVLTVVPNIFGTPRHPSVERGTASAWLARTVSYRSAASGGALGYSFIAEAYLNFGWIGPLVVILLGYLLASAECFAARSASPAATSLMGVIMVFGLIFTRGESTDIVRPIVWCGFMPLALLSLFVAQKKLWRRHSSAARIVPGPAARLFARSLPRTKTPDSD
jgi:hypothetical protein